MRDAFIAVFGNFLYFQNFQISRSLEMCKSEICGNINLKVTCVPRMKCMTCMYLWMDVGI